MSTLSRIKAILSKYETRVVFETTQDAVFLNICTTFVYNNNMHRSMYIYIYVYRS